MSVYPSLSLPVSPTPDARTAAPEFITKNEWVYARLKEDIARGVLGPGERIVVARIAKMYSVSPMPVRDALNRLSQDGFVEITPHAGATVVSVDTRQLGEILVIRMELESMAAALAVPLLQPESLDILEKLHERMQRCAEEDDRTAYDPLNWEFHDYIYSRCGNATLYTLVMSMWRRSCITRTVFVRLPFKLQRSTSDHREWLDAIRAGDAETVRRIARAHIKHTLDRLETFIDAAFPPLPESPQEWTDNTPPVNH